jgi:hypothetical protein
MVLQELLVQQEQVVLQELQVQQVVMEQVVQV